MTWPSFARAFALPQGIDADQIKASFEHGVLQLEVPNPPERQPQKIAVSSTAPSEGPVEVTEAPPEAQQTSEGRPNRATATPVGQVLARTRLWQMEEEPDPIAPTVVPLPPGHGWRARPGFKVVVANRGAARFDVPRDWVMGRSEGCDLCLHDRPPPDDHCRLEFSLLPIPRLPGGAPALDELLDRSTRGDDLEELSRSQAASEFRDGLELVWNEIRFRDADTQRLALNRNCLAAGVGFHALVTLSLWADDAERFDPAWHEVLRSLDLGRPVDLSGRDPRRN